MAGRDLRVRVFLTVVTRAHQDPLGDCPSLFVTKDGKMNYPILEYDPSHKALLEPSQLLSRQDVPEHCVICFFREVIDKVIRGYDAKMLAENRWEDGPHPLYEISYKGERLAFFHPGVGAPMAAGLLEEVIALGCREFIVCGGCGVLQREIAVGHLIVVSSAIRAEGVSYHYLPPNREVVAHSEATSVLMKILSSLGIPHLIGKTWTTDAPYGETRSKIAHRREEGCLCVEMEAGSDDGSSPISWRDLCSGLVAMTSAVRSGSIENGNPERPSGRTSSGYMQRPVLRSDRGCSCGERRDKGSYS